MNRPALVVLACAVILGAAIYAAGSLVAAAIDRATYSLQLVPASDPKWVFNRITGCYVLTHSALYQEYDTGGVLSSLDRSNPPTTVLQCIDPLVPQRVSPPRSP